MSPFYVGVIIGYFIGFATAVWVIALCMAARERHAPPRREADVVQSCASTEAELRGYMERKERRAKLNEEIGTIQSDTSKHETATVMPPQKATV